MRCNQAYDSMFVDIIENRLKMAKKLGADATYLVQKDKPEEHVVADIHEIFGDEPNRTIDASGAQASIRLAILVSISENSICVMLIRYT